MADATIAIDGLEALQVGRDIAAQVTLEDPLVLSDQVKDLVELFLREVLGPHVGIKARFLDEDIGPAGADAVDVT